MTQAPHQSSMPTALAVVAMLVLGLVLAWILPPPPAHGLATYLPLHTFVETLTVVIEALGFAGPDLDIEHLLMSARLWKLLGMAGHIRLEINTLGGAEARASHRQKLIAYFEARQDQLDEDARDATPVLPIPVLSSEAPSA